jgi:putative peptidoglycan lipid II flippase
MLAIVSDSQIPSLARSTAIMSVGTVISRVTGVVRLAVIAAALGIVETRLQDTYNLANTAPNILYELVLGGVISSVFVPVFVELLEKEDRDRAWEVFSGIINVSLLILSAVTVIGVVAAPWIADFYADRLSGGDAEAQARVLVFLLRLFIPQVILYGLYFVLAGLLNAHKRFGAPMYTPILNNFVVIAAFLAFHAIYGEVSLATVTSEQLWLIGLATTFSVAPMGLLLIPLVRKMGRYHLTLSLDHPAVRKLGRLAIYVVGFVAATQVGYVIIQWLANAKQGGYSAYVSASTFFLLPMGLFVWSMTTALVPTLSQHAVNERWTDFRATLTLGMRSLMFLMLPAAAGYFILARPIVRVLLEHGVVTASSTVLVAELLQVMVLGLVQAALYQMMVRSFYAMQDTKTPFWINLAMVALNVGLNFPLFRAMGVSGLALGQVIATTVAVAIQLKIMSGRIGGLEIGSLAQGFGRAAVATAGMGLVVWAMTAFIAGPDDDASTTIAALEVTAAVIVGGALYLLLARALGVKEVAYLRSIVARRKT